MMLKLNITISERDCAKYVGNYRRQHFGKPLGYKYGYVKDCEHGKKPSLEYLFKVSNYYSVSLDWLIRGIESIRSNENGIDTELEEIA